MSRVRLEPRLGRRVFFLAGSLFVCAIGVGAITSGALIVGVLALALGLYALPFAAGRMFLPNAYVTEVDRAGFRVHDSFGRVAHDVRWHELAELREVSGNAPLRPGADRLVGFKLVTPPATRRRMRKPGVDGYLPDPYAGFEEVEAVLVRHAEGAPVRTPDLP